MPRVSRLFVAAVLSTLAALLPVTAFAAGSPSLTVYVTGVQYAVGVPPCTGGTTSSFAGFGSVIPGGQSAVFQTTICHTGISDAGADILPGGSFAITTGPLTLVGKYLGGKVGHGDISGRYFCKQVFPVSAEFAPFANIKGGHADGSLTHYGKREGTACHAYAATIAGVATLMY